MGDFGTDGSKTNQIKVANAMNAWCAQHGCDFILGTADNVYPAGVDSADDWRFDDYWKNVYDMAPLNELIWYQSLGNHDHGPSDLADGREMYQVEYGDTEPLWYMPDRYYSFDYEQGGVRGKFIIADSQSLRRNKNNPSAQRSWLRGELEDYRDGDYDWCVAVAHHPPISGGRNSGSTTTRRDILPVLEEFDCQLSFWGHEHNLQHMRLQGDDPSDTELIVSGGGGRGIYSYDRDAEDVLRGLGYELKIHEADFGFVTVEMDKNSALLTYYNADGEAFYSFTKQQ